VITKPTSLSGNGGMGAIMRLGKLILENFSSYCGKHQIEFHTTSEKPVIVIVGASGMGKTSIFDAINWALYGKQYEPVLEKENEKRLQIM